MAALSRLVIAVVAAVPTTALSAGSDLVPLKAAQHTPFALDALSGSRAALDDYRGGTVILHFFAVWCEPCRAELAALERLSARMAQNSVTIVAVDVGEVDDRVQRFFASQPVSFAVTLDRDRAVAKSWNVDVLPTTFVLDRALVPRFIAIGDCNWDKPEVAQILEMLDHTPLPAKSTALDAPIPEN